MPRHSTLRKSENTSNLSGNESFENDAESEDTQSLYSPGDSSENESCENGAESEDTQSLYSPGENESCEDDANIPFCADDLDHAFADSSLYNNCTLDTTVEVEVVMSLAATSDIRWCCCHCAYWSQSHREVEQHYLRIHCRIQLFRCNTHEHDFYALHELSVHMNMPHDKELANVQWADGTKKKIVSIACLFCSINLKSSREYVQHCREMHWKVKYCCSQCKDEFTTQKSCKDHQKRHIQGNLKEGKIEVGMLSNHSYETKIEMALKALPKSPTREIIADWILNNIPPPPEHRGGCRDVVLRTLRQKFQQTEEGHWIQTQTKKSVTRTPIERLVAIAFYNKSFQPSTVEQIYELIDGYLGESKVKAIATIKRHLNYAENRYEKHGTVKELYEKRPKDVWRVREESKAKIELQAKTTLTGANHANPGLTFPQLAVEALADGPKNCKEIYHYISQHYPFHIRSKKKIKEAVRKLKFPKVGDCYQLRNDINLRKRKREQDSGFQHVAKRMRPNVNGSNNEPTSFLPLESEGYPKRNSPLEDDDNEEDDPEKKHDPKKCDPYLLENGIGTPIKPREQAEEMYRRLAVLHRASYYYGNNGAGLEEIANQKISGRFLRELLYNLHLEEKQARERKQMGNGWMWSAHFSGVILSNIHRILFTKPLLEVLPPPSSSYEEASENAKSLFAANGCCFSCLTNHEAADVCKPFANSLQAYPSPRFRYTYHELFLILLGEHATFSTLSKPTIYCWLQHNRPSGSDEERLKCIREFCEMVGKDENGHDLLTLKRQFTARRTEATFETAISPSPSGGAFPDLPSFSSKPAPQDSTQPPSSSTSSDAIRQVSHSMSPEDVIEEVEFQLPSVHVEKGVRRSRQLKESELGNDWYESTVQASTKTRSRLNISKAISTASDGDNMGPTHAWDGLRIEDARMQDPGTLDWRWVIQNAGHSSIAKAKRSTIIHLQRMFVYYGKLGMGIQKIENATITNTDLARIIYPLALANKQAGLRADKGLGWQMIEYMSRKITQNIETAQFGCSIFNPKWGNGPDDLGCLEMGYERFVEIRLETLFPVETGCTVCLKVDHPSDKCTKEQSEVSAVRRPIPGSKVKHSYYELISMALSEEDGSNRELPRAMIYKWIGLHCTEKNFERIIDEILPKRFDQLHNDVWKKRPSDVSKVQSWVKQESSQPLQIDVPDLEECYPTLRFIKGEEWHNKLMIYTYFDNKFTIIDVEENGEGGFHIRFDKEDEAVLALCLDGKKLLPKDKKPFRLERV